ncbi:MAG: glycoside hydrolase family 43 protein [Acidimicrobiales bacterium]
MTRRRLASAWVAVLAAAVLGATEAVQAEASAAPIYAGDFADPFVAMAGLRYYAYATQTGAMNIQVMTSGNMVDWSSPVEALPALPAWARRGRTWAPSVLRRGERWVLYYTVRHRDSGRQCISAAVANLPDGPFVDTSIEPLICQTERGGSIDPSPFVDADGTAYLYWKSDDNALGRPTSLWGRRLEPDGLAVGGPVLELRQDLGWEWPLIEGPSMVAADGRYYLFYGANWWESAGAGIGYALCETALGPCTKMATDAAWLGSSAVAAGPAGPQVFRDASGTLFLAYHAWEPGRVGYAGGGARALWIDRIVLDQGRPTRAFVEPPPETTTGVWRPSSGRLAIG